MARGSLTPQEIENRETISKNINRLIEEKNVTQVDISNHTGIPKSTITGYVKATSTPNSGNIQKLADYFEVPKSSIDPRFKKKPKFGINQVKEFTKIPLLGTITCGEPILAEENIEGYINEISDLLPSGELFYLKSKGDSMVPTIPQNSNVLIRHQQTVEEGEVAAVLVNGDTEATLKRVKHQGNLILLVADNPKYDPIVITKENPARVIGKAVKASFDIS